MIMKNIQIIDGADNCSYEVYSISEDDFESIFPAVGQDVEFNSDLADRLGTDKLIALNKRIWKHPANKKEIVGLHGLLFFDLDEKKKFYPDKIESGQIACL